MPSNETRRIAAGLYGLAALSPEQVAQLEAENAVRQFARVIALAEAAVRAGTFRLTPEIVSEMHALAVSGLEPSPGTYRSETLEITGSKHRPPPWQDVPELIRTMCEYVDSNWQGSSSVHLFAYTMWRINWIHPFMNGNGRTSRAVAYLVLCAHAGVVLPGSPTIAESIVATRRTYYRALERADSAILRRKVVDLSALESLTLAHLGEQLRGGETDAAD